MRQVNKLLGPEWPEWPEAGPPPPRYFDRRTAQAALEAILTDVRRGHMEVFRTGVSFERLRVHLLPAFGHLRVQQLTTARIERWKSDYLVRTGKRRQAAKLVALIHSMYERARVLYGIQRNAAADVSRIRLVAEWPTSKDATTDFWLSNLPAETPSSGSSSWPNCAGASSRTTASSRTRSASITSKGAPGRAGITTSRWSPSPTAF